MIRVQEAKQCLARTKGRLLNACYYQFVFGRCLPFSRQWVARFQAWEREHGAGDTPVSQNVWQQQYEGGTWAFLNDLGELARYSIIVGYLNQLKPHAAVLDIGCGEGILFSRYRPYGYARYLGIDISAAALVMLKQVEDANTTFVCADAETYMPGQRFDVIVFNESLYYFHAPVEAVQRYTGALEKHGIMIVSTFTGSARARAILRTLKARHALVDETRVTHAALSWLCSVFSH